jgi:hypothetical protein
MSYGTLRDGFAFLDICDKSNVGLVHGAAVLAGSELRGIGRNWNWVGVVCAREAARERREREFPRDARSSFGHFVYLFLAEELDAKSEPADAADLLGLLRSWLRFRRLSLRQAEWASDIVARAGSELDPDDVCGVWRDEGLLPEHVSDLLLHPLLFPDFVLMERILSDRAWNKRYAGPPGPFIQIVYDMFESEGRELYLHDRVVWALLGRGELSIRCAIADLLRTPPSVLWSHFGPEDARARRRIFSEDRRVARWQDLYDRY